VSEKKLLPVSVVKLLLVDPPVNLTQPFRELTLPENVCPFRAPATYSRTPPPAIDPVIVADVRPRAKRMRICPNETLLKVTKIAKTAKTRIVFEFITISSRSVFAAILSAFSSKCKEKSPLQEPTSLRPLRKTLCPQRGTVAEFFPR